MVVNGSLAGPEIHFELRYYFAINELFITNFYCIWKLIETCVIPIITYACELWDPNKEEKGTINRILDNMIKRILMVPTSTPRENLYIETGIKDMTHNMTHRRINMLCRLETTNSNMKTSILEIENPKTWTNSTIKIMQDMGWLVCWSLTSLCHSNGHIVTMPAREINPFTALTRILSQFLRT